MEKIRFITDSACDIPAALAEQYHIQILPIPITIGSQTYLERVDFTNEQFYQKLLESPALPVTSHITALDFMQAYHTAAEEGYTHVILVTINSAGSNMFSAANLAVQMLAEEYPAAAARLTIEVLDSKNYTVSYGMKLVEAARLVQQGKTAAEITLWLREWFDSCEIYFTPFTLEFVKKSGRVNSTAAFVGDILGLRPVIRLMDTRNEVLEKIRGDKNIVPTLARYAQNRMVKGSPYYVVHGMEAAPGQELAKLMKKQVGYPPVGIYPVGACIAINAGPRVVGIVLQGQLRVK